MSKKDFIALADMIREHNNEPKNMPFTAGQIVAGVCGPNGGVK